MQRCVNLARKRGFFIVHDFAYADLGFDGYEPPSILQAEGAREVAVELYSLTKSFSMAGWRVAFLVGNAATVAALAKLKSYLDYGSFQPVQIAAATALNEVPDYPDAVREPTAVAATSSVAAWPGKAGMSRRRRRRCSPGRRSPSPTATSRHSSSR